MLIRIAGYNAIWVYSILLVLEPKIYIIAQTKDTLLPPAENKLNAKLIFLQKNIFEKSCALSTCHDGSFEPDFRTLQSSYATTVYHPIVKNNKSQKYKYRILPFKPDESVLYKRITTCCFVNTNDRMPFTVGDTLSEAEIQLVYEWIKEGARNLTYDISEEPLEQPSFENYFHFGTNATPKVYARTDKNEYNPIIFKTHTDTLTIQAKIKNWEQIDTTKLKCIFLLYRQPDYSDAPIEYSTSISLQKVQAVFPTKELLRDIIYYVRIKFTYMQQDFRYFPDVDMEFQISHINSFMVQ